ncbi:hypothetical protein Tsubulata_044389 [Turnera subulata]|uniref:Glutaredoxin domain-containing protein n=1 Tax=Turnera subulata TaxID=218843 RepID=A0A9Q0FI00_9ROSI|nr:hypothetical protein Tsubulata_044389 [Turnera subulata]
MPTPSSCTSPPSASSTAPTRTHANRSILCVPLDERDVSMDDEYLNKLQEIVSSKKVNLPMVFIGRNYIHDVEEIKERQESSGASYEAYGGLRFPICEVCNGRQ